MEHTEKDQGRDNDDYIRFKPIGVVHNNSQDTNWGDKFQALNWQERAARMKAQTQEVSELIINADLEDALDRIEEYSHLLVIYFPHLVPSERRPSLKVHPMGSSHFPLVGVLATCSPIRPNSILATKVRLLKRDRNILHVTGLDALDGSPILDIKPCMPESTDGEEVTVPHWMQQVNERFLPGDEKSG